ECQVGLELPKEVLGRISIDVGLMLAHALPQIAGGINIEMTGYGKGFKNVNVVHRWASKWNLARLICRSFRAGSFFMHFLGFRFAGPQAIIPARLRRLRATLSPFWASLVLSVGDGL